MHPGRGVLQRHVRAEQRGADRHLRLLAAGGPLPLPRPPPDSPGPVQSATCCDGTCAYDPDWVGGLAAREARPARLRPVSLR